MADGSGSTGGLGAARGRLPADVLEAIRRERLQPRWTDPHFLHLVAIKRGLEWAVAHAGATGPCLDLYCGTQPYRSLHAGRQVWGLDIDEHFGSADVIGDVPLPFASAAFTLVVCTQTLYLRSDDREVVAEMRRLLQPGGAAIVTVPYLWKREGWPVERRYSRTALAQLFDDWTDVEVRGIGSAGTGLAYVLGSYLAGARRRWSRLRIPIGLVAAVVNAIGWTIDAVSGRLSRRTGAVWVIVARRPGG